MTTTGADKKQKSFDFICIPTGILENKKLTATDMLVYGYLYTCLENLKTPRHYLSLEQISNGIFRALGTVSESVNRLCQKGLIKRTKGQGHKSYYELSENETKLSENETKLSETETKLSETETKLSETEDIDNTIDNPLEKEKDNPLEKEKKEKEERIPVSIGADKDSEMFEKISNGNYKSQGDTDWED